MRFIKTFILRFYMDTDLHDQICGDLQSLPKRKLFPFKNETELRLLLQWQLDKEAVDLSPSNLQDENGTALAEGDHE